MTRKRQLLRGLVFLIVLAVAIGYVNGFFGLNRARNHTSWNGLRLEKRGSMDAIIIGASNVIEFWQPALGWADHGIAVWSCSVPSLTCAAIKYMIIEARKTQPDALYIVNLSTFKGDGLSLDVSHLHNALDYVPLSMNKLRLTNDLVGRSEYRGLDALEYYLPIIRFHSRWDSLQPWIFGIGDLSLKLSFKSTSFVNTVLDISGKLKIDNDVREPVPEDIGEVFGELLDYCDSQHVNVLFLKSPQTVTVKRQGHMNTLEDILKARGYPCLDLMEDFYDTGLDPRTDYRNYGHTNIHGVMKFCRAVGDYLVENYGFEDKRGLPGWESWDKAGKTYMNYCEAYTLPIEREHVPRFVSEIPALARLSVKNRDIRVGWTGIEGVDGYAVFRKANKGEKTWRWVADVDAGLEEYTDADLKASTRYYYTVVPYRQSDGTREYGSFDVLGVNAETGGKGA